MDARDAVKVLKYHFGSSSTRAEFSRFTFYVAILATLVIIVCRTNRGLTNGV
jgi:hypothetical protein